MTLARSTGLVFLRASSLAAQAEWVLSSGYRPVGPPMRIFQGDPGSSPQVEMRVPVEK